MESKALSPSPDNADAKAAFRKPSNDAATRKYRRRSPVSGSSSSDGSPTRERNTSPIYSRDDPARDSDPRRRNNDRRDLDKDYGRNRRGRSGDSYRSSRSSHNYHRRDDYARHEKHEDEEERDYSKSSSHPGRESRVGSQSDHTRRESEHYKSRDHLRGDDKYSRDRLDGSRNRNRDKDNDSLIDKVGSGRRHTNSSVEDTKSGERDRRKGDGDGRDEKREYRRSLGDYKGDISPIYGESRGHRNDSTSRRDSSRHHSKELSISNGDPRELDGQKYTKGEKKKYDDRETGRHKDRFEDKSGFTGENKEYSAKKPKLFSLGTDHGKVSKFTTAADEGQSSSSKQAQELVGKVTSEEAPAKGSEAANDLDAAKIAAMKAAELVNKNLIGTGYMSTDQKKKLLWGNKKNTAAEESGHRWDATLFPDRERQEKFNKLMSLRLPWYLWPIVGCEGRPESRQSRKQRPTGGEADGTATAGFGEAVHCWTPSQRWSHCRTRSLRIYLGCYCSRTMTFRSIVLYFVARIVNIYDLVCNGCCSLPFLLVKILVMMRKGVLHSLFFPVRV